ncbi:MAG: NUDIX hydrolase [Bacillota bacterium]|nr:NUDIX hydrolase [Bacillota bacterium]MDW7684062.1 NUDIX hydrolase [Bacillota bacterium]
MEKTTASKMIYQGKIINVRVDDVELQNGTHSKREIVEHPGAVAVLAVTDDKRVYFVKQFRKPIEKELLEIPAGKLDAGEGPRVCAVRELGEEIGMAAEELRQIAFFYSSPGFASEKMYIYLATGLKPVDVEKPEDEFLQESTLPLKDAVAMARNGEIEDAKTLVALLLGADILGV